MAVGRYHRQEIFYPIGPEGQKTLQQAMFTMPGSDVKQLVITAEMVKNGLKPITVAGKKPAKKKRNVA